MQLIVNSPKPVIAEVNGVATAAGCQLVASCDLAISSDAAKFATPGVNIGLFCSTPMVALSRNVNKKDALKMLLTGDMINAHEAKRISLINEHVPENEITKSVMDLAHKISKIVGYTGEIEWDKTKPDGVPRKLLDISKLNELGFKSVIGLDEGIKKTVEEFRDLKRKNSEIYSNNKYSKNSKLRSYNC